METLWNGIHGMEFHGMEFNGTELMVWNFMERNSWNGNRIDGTFFKILSNAFIFQEKLLLYHHVIISQIKLKKKKNKLKLF